VRHATDHDEDLDDSGVFEENEPLFPPNVMRIRISLNKKLGL
jgi:hypothetical protein